MNMGIFAVLLLYIVLAVILAILAFVLKNHTKYPDFRVGYHDRRIMNNKNKWNYANSTAGNLCALFAIISLAVAVLLYFIKAGVEAAIVIFFALSITAILTILILPIYLSKKFD